MNLPERPSLDATVISALASDGSETWWRCTLAAHRVSVSDDFVEVHYGGGQRHVSRWHSRDCAAALESLATHDLWPWPTQGERAGRWWCRCDLYAVAPQRKEQIATFVRSMSSGRYLTCPCRAVGHTEEPPSVDAIATVASLGRASLLRAEAIVDDLSPGARVAWRTMDRAALKTHHRRVGGHGDASDFATMFAHAVRFGFVGAAPDVFKQSAECAAIRQAWPALCGLYAIGVHLLASAPGAVVLAVEST